MDPASCPKSKIAVRAQQIGCAWLAASHCGAVRWQRAWRGGIRRLRLQPALQHRGHIFLLMLVERMAARNAMPFRQATAAAGCRRMLRDENRMAAKRRLPSVVAGTARRQPLLDEVARMLHHDGKSLGLQIRALLRPQMKPAPECGTGQCLEHGIDIGHGAIGSIRCGSLLPTLLTSLPTRYHSKAPAGSAIERASCSACCAGMSGSSHSCASSAPNTTGRRSCTSPLPPSAAAVTITNPEPSCSGLPGRTSVMAAIHIGASVRNRIYHGCLCRGSPVHSYQPSAGTIARPLFHRWRKNGPLAAFSTRALLAIGMPL